jgi:hypothetical protein
MRTCFRTSFCWLIPAIAWAAGGNTEHRIRSVVKADVRTGRLVRSIVVRPKVIAPKVITSSAAVPAAIFRAPDIPGVVAETARRYNIDPLLVHSMIQVESAYNPYAVSHKGAQGLMQLMPATARRFGVNNVFRIRDNIEGGVKYLSYLRDLFKGKLQLMLAAYNAGEGAVIKYNYDIPPYRETENYVYQVGKRYGEARAREKVTEPPPEVVSVPPPEPEHKPLDVYYDDSGKLHMRTR